jgi:hypothetical protein
MILDHNMTNLLPDIGAMYSSLNDGQLKVADRADTMLALRQTNLSGAVRSFLQRWTNREISVLPPRE